MAWLARQVSRWDPRHPDIAALAPERLPADMEGEARQLARALHSLGGRVEAQLERERNFTRDASHELRTPLTVIRVASDMALEEPEVPARVARSLQRIQRSGRDMEAVIDAFLILARESEIEPQSEWFDVCEVVQEEAANARALLGDKPVALEVHCNGRPQLYAPPRVLHVVIGNLLRNACSYTDRGTVEVTVEPDGVVVADTGIGMAPEALARAFEPFYRAAPERPMGTGVGPVDRVAPVRALRLDDRPWPAPWIRGPSGACTSGPGTAACAERVPERRRSRQPDAGSGVRVCDPIQVARMSRSPRPQVSRIHSLPVRIVAGLVVLSLLGAGVWFWRQHKAAGEEAAFRTAPVERGGIRVAISSTGTLSAISTVTVGSQISGQVLEVLADFNDEVRQGQVLARIDPKTYETQIAQGNAQVANARASLNQAIATQRNAQLDYNRKAELVQRQLVARSDVDLARAALDQADAQVASARAQIQQQTAATQTTRVNLDRTVIRSPVNGVVLTRSIEPGQTVAASLQAPELFTIAEDLSQMKIELAVDEADIGQVRPGQGVSFTVDAFPDRQFRGEVQQVRLSATTTNNVVTYPVVVNVDNADGTLLPGLTVNAEIEVSRRDDVLKVSNAALRFKPASAAPAGGIGVPAPRQAPGQAGQRPGGGMADDLARVAGGLKLDAAQQSKFDEALSRDPPAPGGAPQYRRAGRWLRSSGRDGHGRGQQRGHAGADPPAHGRAHEGGLRRVPGQS